MVGKSFIYNKHFPCKSTLGFAYDNGHWMKATGKNHRDLFSKEYSKLGIEELTLFFPILEEFLFIWPKQCCLWTKTLPIQWTDQKLCPPQSARNMVVYTPLFKLALTVQLMYGDTAQMCSNSIRPHQQSYWNSASNIVCVEENIWNLREGFTLYVSMLAQRELSQQ